MASPPFNIAETTPGDNDFVRLYPAAERLFRDIVESWLALEHDATTGRHTFPADTTANLAALTFPDGSLKFDTTTQVLIFQEPGAFQDVISFPNGTRMLFQQTNAPTGWVKQTDGSLSDAGVRIVTSTVGTGGSNTFTTLTPSGSVTVNSHTLTQAQMPSHFHKIATFINTAGGDFLDAQRNVASNLDYTFESTSATPDVFDSGSAGSSQGHNHGASFAGNALDIKWVSFILAQKS